jgi:hypothetical protein
VTPQSCLQPSWLLRYMRPISGGVWRLVVFTSLVYVSVMVGVWWWMRQYLLWESAYARLQVVGVGASVLVVFQLLWVGWIPSAFFDIAFAYGRANKSHKN